MVKDKSFPLISDQLLLAGAVLRQTKWVLGVVVYTGRYTRTMMNTNLSSHVKQSDVEKIMNKFIAFILATQVGLCIILTFHNYIWHNEPEAEAFL
jgi:phospholipid-transporting ATPase